MPTLLKSSNRYQWLCLNNSTTRLKSNKYVLRIDYSKLMRSLFIQRKENVNPQTIKYINESTSIACNIVCTESTYVSEADILDRGRKGQKRRGWGRRVYLKPQFRGTSWFCKTSDKLPLGQYSIRMHTLGTSMQTPMKRQMF